MSSVEGPAQGTLKGRQHDRTAAELHRHPPNGETRVPKSRPAHTWWPPHPPRVKHHPRRPHHYAQALRRTPIALWRDDATDSVAALTYYTVLAIIPALLVTVAAIGLAGSQASSELATEITDLVPAQSRQLIHEALTQMSHQRTAAWLLTIFGTVGALWSSSSYLSVFRRALHRMNGAVDHHTPWRKAPRIVITACALLALLVTSAFTLVLTGDAVHEIGPLLGVGSTASVVWTGLKWPLLLALAAVLVLIVFRTGPPGTRHLRRALPGGVLAVLLWLLMSAGFALYAAHSGTYSRLYGSLAGSVVFLVWLWLSNLSLVAGAQFNAELAAAHGHLGSSSMAAPATARNAPEPEDDTLRGRWLRTLTAVRTEETPDALPYADELLTRWAEPQRSYHTADHLLAVLEHIDTLAPHAAGPEAVRLAAWFHDAVYRPDRSENEERSAVLAVRALTEACVPADVTDEVARLVRLTVTHDPAPGDTNGEVLCDADLAILAGEPEEYEAYTRAVREEYGFVPDDAFRAGRAAVLRQLLDLQRLFRTPHGAAAWEERARANLTAELETLTD